MKIVSSFVREQQRYSKNQLRSRFSFDDEGVESVFETYAHSGVISIPNATVAYIGDVLDHV